MPAWFTDDPNDVWEGLTPETTHKVNRWIRRSEAIISARFPDIHIRVQRGQLTAEIIASVIEEMVDRAINQEQRDGISQMALPEWSVSFDQAQGLSKGSVLFLTTDEYALLAPPRTGARIGSMRMRRSYEATDPAPPTTRARLDSRDPQR